LFPRNRKSAAIFAFAVALSVGAYFQSTRPAEAIIAILIGIRQGPVGLTRGTEAVIGLYATSEGRRTAPIGASVGISDGTSNTVLVAENLALTPGGPCEWVRIAVLGDGSVRVNGKPIAGNVPESGQLQLVSQVRSRAPRGINIHGSLQLVDLDSGKVTAVLPYIEQDNL
jgi:hypothetical protein